MGSDAASSAEAQAVVASRIHRTSRGWRVWDEELPDLLNAMVLADLMLEEQGSGDVDRNPPPRVADGESEVERLRVTVTQLEHALHTRIVVEQAIGVLTERHRVAPRQAFDRLRFAARSRGRRVADLARSVVRSTSDPLIALPVELAREGCVVEAK